MDNPTIAEEDRDLQTLDQQKIAEWTKKHTHERGETISGKGGMIKWQ